MNESSNNLGREIQRCLILLDSSHYFLSESCFMKTLRDEMKGVAEEMQPYLDNLYVLSDFLGDYELMNLEFIRAFGIYEFIEASDNTRTIETLLALCSLVCESEDITDLPNGYLKNHKRAERRALERRTRKRAIQLGSAAIYEKDLEDSEDDSLLKGKLVRDKGIIFKKLDTAARESREYVRAETARRIYMHAKHLIKLAEKYKDYTILYRGRYFKDTSKDIQLPDVLEDTPVKKGKEDVFFVRLPEESAGYEYRYSSQYVKAHGDVVEDADTAEELYPSEKDNVPMSIRRNKSHVTVTLTTSKADNNCKDNTTTLANQSIPLSPIVSNLGRSYGFL